MSSVYQTPKPNNILWDLDRRLKKLETNLARNLIIGASGVHIPGSLTVGGGPEAGEGGGGLPLNTGTPDVITGLTPTTGADATNVWINLAWTFPDTSVAKVAMFEVRWKRSGDSEYTYATTTASDNYRINGLESGVTYDLGVRSISTFNLVSDWVTDTQVAATDSTAPLQVTGLTVAVGVTNQMGSWNENSEADLAHYQVQVDNNSGFGSPTVDQIVTASLLTVDGLNNNTTYYWRVRGVDKSGNAGTWSTSANDDTILIPSAYIVELTADKIKAGTIGTEILTLSNSVNSKIESFDGTSLILRGDGSAEFTDIKITGLDGTTGFNIGGANGLHIDSTGNMWSGDAAFGDLNSDFKVTPAGVLSAVNATIEGTLATGSSGNYVSISGQSVSLYDGGVLSGQLTWGVGLFDTAMYLDGQGHGGITISDDINITASGVTPYPQINIFTQSGATIYGAAVPPNFKTAGSITIRSMDDLNLMAADDVYLQGENIYFEDPTGDMIASLSWASSAGLLTVTSDHATEGAELLLDHGNAWSNELHLDNWYDGSSTSYGRLLGGIGGATILAKWDLGTSWYSKDVSATTDERALYSSRAADGNIIGTLSSSIRVKEDVRPLTLDYAYEMLESIDPVHFSYKKAPGSPRIGFIAENVAEHMPFAAPRDDDDIPVGINDHYLTPVPWRVLQDVVRRMNEAGI
jgi:hypothetical protein